MVGTDSAFPERIREVIVFQMACVASMTLLINGTTCSKLVDYLGMIKE